MNEELLYLSLVKSLTRWCVDQIADDLTDFEFIDWDEHADIHELPDGDLFGIAGVGMVTDEGIYDVVFGLAAATTNDTGLNRLRTLISKCRGRLKPGTTIPFYDLVTEQPLTYILIKSPVAIEPMTRAGTRPFQGLDFVATIDPHAPYAG
jgi:hypothetical protein